MADSDKTPTGQETTAPKPPVGQVDIGKILLPKKEAPAAAGRERVNAGVLLEQEQSAALVPPELAPQVPTPQGELPKKEDSSIQAFQTYQGDIEKIVQTEKVSVVSVAAKEAERRGMQSLNIGKSAGPSVLSRLLLVVGAVALFVGGMGLVAYVLYGLQSTAAPSPISAPLVYVDGLKTVTVFAGEPRGVFMQALQNAKQSVNLSLGLVEGVSILASATTSGAAPQALDAQTFLAFLAPDVPPEFLRTVRPLFLFGVHSFDGNQPFVLLKVDSYERAYAEMLAWEGMMRSDFLPLFAYAPRPRIPEENIGTTTEFVSENSFVDKIVENHDARVVQDQYGDILFLWAFLDRSTIIITTNQYTLREAASRLSQAPIVPTGGR